MKPTRRGPSAATLATAALVVVGWVAIVVVHPLGVGAPVIVLALAWAALVLGGVALLRAALGGASDAAISDAAYFRPIGAVDELALEKQSLLKAIKEVEFDLALGKMSAADAEELSRFYRGRAIEVIKAIDALGGATSTDARAEIEREVKARLEVETKGRQKGKAKASRKKASAQEPAA